MINLLKKEEKNKKVSLLLRAFTIRATSNFILFPKILESLTFQIIVQDKMQENFTF